MAELAHTYARDLTELDHGVLTPGIEAEEVSKHIHDIFNTEDGAAGYTRRYQQHNYFKHHIGRLVTASGYKPAEGLRILDIGSGSGNTVWPSLEIFPKARIVATDLSVPLLAILLRKDTSGQVTAIQENAQELDFHPDTFDVVIGGAILHHLFYPERAIRKAYSALRPGGLGMFFEPCQNGQVMVKIAYERIALDPRFAMLSSEIQRVVRRHINFIDLRLRLRADLEPETFAALEDKWMFSRSHLRKILSSEGARDIRVLSLDPPKNAISEKVLSNFRILEVDVPDWIHDIVRDFDAGLPDDFKAENPTGVALSFRK